MTAKPTAGRQPAYNFRATPEYLAWLDGLTTHVNGYSAAEVLEQAAAELAHRVGYTAPPRRLARAKHAAK